MRRRREETSIDSVDRWFRKVDLLENGITVILIDVIRYYVMDVVLATFLVNILG